MYQRIKELRKEKNLTQSYIAEYLNCSQRTYSYYERGEANIPVDILIKLAEFYKTSMDYLINRTNIKEFYPVIKKEF